MKRVKWMLVTLATGALLSGGLYADDYRGFGPGPGCKNGNYHGPMFRDGRGGMVMGMLNSLDLDDKQKEQIEKLMVENRYKMKGLRRGAHSDALKASLKENGFDKKSYVKLSKERAEKRAEMMADHLEKVMAVLTKAQRKMLKEKLEKGEFPRPGFGPRR